jgi:hypothetical protein
MKARDLKPGHMIDGWTVTDVCIWPSGSKAGVVLLKLELRQEVYTGFTPENDGSVTLRDAVVAQAKTTRWYRAWEDVEGIE